MVCRSWIVKVAWIITHSSLRVTVAIIHLLALSLQSRVKHFQAIRQASTIISSWSHQKYKKACLVLMCILFVCFFSPFDEIIWKNKKLKYWEYGVFESTCFNLYFTKKMKNKFWKKKILFNDLISYWSIVVSRILIAR